MRRRIVPAAAAAALVFTGLTACASASASAGSGGDGCANPLHPGALSDGVTVAGGSVEVHGPTDIVNAQRTVIAGADGAERGAAAEPGGIVTADVTIVDAVSGDELDRREQAPHLAMPESVLPDLRKALKGEEADSLNADYLIATALICARPGDTLVVGMTPMQAAASQLGMNAAVAVIDVLATYPARAEGAVRGLPSGFPAVATDETGRPGVVLPPQAAPSDLRVAPRILGDGEEVTAESSVIGQALTVGWDGNVVANTWESGVTGFGTVEGPNPEFGFREALDGYPVGSQLVILDPNDGDPVVHVVDIIAAA